MYMYNCVQYGIRVVGACRMCALSHTHTHMNRFVYICIYIYECIWYGVRVLRVVRMCALSHLRAHINRCVYMYMYIYECIWFGIREFGVVWMSALSHTFIYIHIQIYTCIHMCRNFADSHARKHMYISIYEYVYKYKCKCLNQGVRDMASVRCRAIRWRENACAPLAIEMVTVCVCVYVCIGTWAST